MYKKNNKMVVIGIIVGFLLLIGIGYAAMNQKLDITGTSKITSEWNIAITDAKMIEATGLAENNTVSFDNVNASFDFNFNSPGDTIKYAVTVTNKGTLDATLDSIKIISNNPEVIEYKVDGINSGELLSANNSKEFYVTFKLSDELTDLPEETSFNIETNINYLQEGNSSNFSGADSDTVNELTIRGVELIPDEYSIKATVDAVQAIKYYYSIDNDKWYESSSNSYTLTGLNIDAPYTVYIKAEDTNGNTVISSNTTRTIDKTSPNIVINEEDIIEGQNGWKKSVVLTSVASDNYKVEKMKYCVGSTTCTPSTEANLVDGKYDITLNTSENNQVLCVQAIDTFNNVSNNTCSTTYKVDNVDPVLSTIIATPNDDTMLVEVTATDTASKPYKYYFSKDSGTTYVESLNPNYTFMELPEGDYLIMAYVEDTAGNTSEAKPTTVTIKHAGFCEHNNIDDFGNCIIASEAGTTDIVLAKQTVEAKGTPDFTKTSPAIQYDIKETASTGTVSTTTTKIYVGTGYDFNPVTGIYTLTGRSYITPDSIDYSSDDYYINSSPTSYSGGTLYKINNITTDTNSSNGTVTYLLNRVSTYTQMVKSYNTSEVGMYSASDNDGKTYYYRGSVGGNYVKFANKYWRIIRVNGDGSVRMIYDGTSVHNNSESSTNRQLTTKAFNIYWNDNTYVGYKYGDVSKFAETNSGSKTFNWPGLSATSKYVFGTSYEFIPASRSYKVAGTTHTGVIGNNQIGYYTCFSTNPDATCQRLMYTTGYNGSNVSMTVKGIAYGTTSLDDARENATDSTIKEYLDTWYNNNLKSLESKINLDTYFCNNRTTSNKSYSTYTNEGYGINPTIYEYEKFYNWASQGILEPTLMCNDVNDRFSVTGIRGNDNLDVPVGLITADEVNMAGGRTDSYNTLYYLHSGTTYWTMSPFYFSDWFYADELTVASSGALGRDGVHGGHGVRPVINIRSDVEFTGTGTKEDPYVIK